MRNELLEFLDKSNTFEVRGLRLLLEYFFANEEFREFHTGPGIGISVFGSARIQPDSKIYQDAVKVGRLLYESNFAVVTGASMGVMEGANRGVFDGISFKMKKEFGEMSESEIMNHPFYKKEIKNYSLGLKINLPFEKEPNSYLGNMVSFHYFAIRKFYFTMLSRGFIRMEGGWGTRDEFWEMCTLVQTGKAPLMPIIVLPDRGGFLKQEMDRNIEGGFINEYDRYLVDIVETPEEAVAVLNNFYKNIQKIHYTRDWDIEIFTKRPLDEKIKTSMEGYLKKHPGIFGSLMYDSDKVLIHGYTFKSFGHLRLLLNILNGLSE